MRYRAILIFVVLTAYLFITGGICGGTATLTFTSGACPTDNIEIKSLKAFVAGRPPVLEINVCIDCTNTTIPTPVTGAKLQGTLEVGVFIPPALSGAMNIPDDPATAGCYKARIALSSLGAGDAAESIRGGKVKVVFKDAANVEFDTQDITIE